MFGKCPHCESLVMTVNLKTVTVRAGTKTWNGVTYQCSSCNKILSVGIDPIALKADTVNEVVKQLSSKSRTGF